MIDNSFLQDLQKDYKKVKSAFIWIVSLLLVSVVSMGAKQLTSDAVNKRQIYENKMSIKDLEVTYVPNFDIAEIIYLMDLKTDAILSVADGDKDEVRNIIKQFNEVINNVLFQEMRSSMKSRGGTEEKLVIDYDEIYK